MEKLQPFLKQKYWICFGLSVIFVLFGWWNASGDLATKTTDRKTSVEGSFSKAAQGASDPNETWVAGGKKENEEDKGAYKTASLQLWKRQQTAREWPEQIRSEMQKIKYFADVPSKETRERWASIYRTQMEDLLKIVQPFNRETGEGLVVVDANRITRQKYDSWRINKPTSNEIWSNQEDIWLLKALLTSISKTNDSATRITESQVPEIKRLHLRGGDPKTKPGAVGSKAGGLTGGASGMPSGFGEMSGGGEMYAGGMTGGGGGGAMNHTHPGKSFEGKTGGDVLTEEFGAVAGAAGMGGMGPGMMGMPSSEGMSGTGGGFGGGKSAAKKEVRYVDDAEKDQGYKTRAFLLDVVVRDERLPDLLAKLTNSDFPVEIRRVEILSRAAGASGGMSGMGGEGMSGYGGGEMSGEGGGGFGGELSGGFGDPSGMSGMPGGSGMMNPGLGDLAGSEGGFPGFGGGTDGGYPGESGTMDPTAGAAAAMKGIEVLNAAMADPLLIEVRIGGLLTLYMTPEEALNQEKTEEKSAVEAAAAAPASANPAATDATTPAIDSTAIDATATDASAASVPAAGDTPKESSETPAETPATPSPDGNTPQPADAGGETPATVPPATSGEPTVPSATGEIPAEPATVSPENGSSSTEPSNNPTPSSAP